MSPAFSGSAASPPTSTGFGVAGRPPPEDGALGCPAALAVTQAHQSRLSSTKTPSGRPGSKSRRCRRGGICRSRTPTGALTSCAHSGAVRQQSSLADRVYPRCLWAIVSRTMTPMSGPSSPVPRSGRPRAPGLAHAGRHPGAAALHGGRPRGTRVRGHPSRVRALRPRGAGEHVRQPPVDHPPIRRVLNGGGVERVLPPEPRGRPDGAVSRVRPRHPPRVRQRSPSRRRRRRQGGRSHRLRRGHEDPLRQHPSRSHDGVHDHERCRAADPGRIRRRR